MEEAPPTRTRRSTKKRDTYSPSRFDTPLQRQPRKSANTVKKSTESPAPSPVSAALLRPPSTSVHSVERKVLPSASTSISSVSRNKNSSAKLSLPSSSSKRPRTSLLKLPKLPPKEEIFISRVKSEPVDAELPKDDVVVTPPPPQQRNIPFDFSNPTAQNLPDRRNKSKSVYQMGLLPRTVPIVRPSRNKRNETPTSDKEANILSTDSVEIKEEQDAAALEESSLLPSTSVNPISHNEGENIVNEGTKNKYIVKKDDLQEFITKNDANVKWTGTKFTMKDLKLQRINTKTLQSLGEIYYKRIVISNSDVTQKLPILPDPTSSDDKPPLYYDILQQKFESFSATLKAEIAQINEKLVNLESGHGNTKSRLSTLIECSHTAGACTQLPIAQ